MPLQSGVFHDLVAQPTKKLLVNSILLHVTLCIFFSMLQGYPYTTPVAPLRSYRVDWSHKVLPGRCATLLHH
ncbi:hypothetical protein V8C86DRAFT_2843334 [Haematococcus lacustris]